MRTTNWAEKLHCFLYLLFHYWNEPSSRHLIHKWTEENDGRNENQKSYCSNSSFDPANISLKFVTRTFFFIASSEKMLKVNQFKECPELIQNEVNTKHMFLLINWLEGAEVSVRNVELMEGWCRQGLVLE